jgi:hypothetical protein
VDDEADGDAAGVGIALTLLAPLGLRWPEVGSGRALLVGVAAANPAPLTAIATTAQQVPSASRRPCLIRSRISSAPTSSVKTWHSGDLLP